MIYFNKFLKYFFVLILLGSFFVSYASETDGTISDIYKGALLCTNDSCTTTTRINFKTTLFGNAVHITDTAVTGDVWSETMGWIRMNPAGGFGGVFNTSAGVLSGYAWGDTAGWISFNCANEIVNNCSTNGNFKVTINSTGQLNGYAWAENYGWIKFDCAVADACVQTDWRPLSARYVAPSGGGSGGGYMTIPTPPVIPPVTPPVVPPVVPSIIKPVVPKTEPKIPPTESIPEPTIPPDNNIVPEVPSFNSPTDGGPDSGSASKSETPPSKEPTTSLFSLAITQAVVGQIFTDIKDSLNKTVEATKKATQEIKRIIEAPTGDITSKVVTTGGAVSGAAISIATVLFANPISFSEIFLIPFRLWSLLLVALGLKKRNRPWGTVYDSVTKQPLDPAYVTLLDMEGNEVASSITDLDGRYGFLVPAGKYVMIAKKTNYEFPSKKLMGKNSDELYQEIYTSGVIEVVEGGVISKNLPMDPLKFDWNEFAKRDQKLMKFFGKRDLWIARISNILFVFGFIITLVAVLVKPATYNIVILVVYLLLLVLKRTILKPRAYGYIESKIDKNPLSFAIMRVFYPGSSNEVIHKVTDKTGRYFCLVPNGTYYTKIENKNPDQTYTLVHTSEPIVVKNGYLGEKFEV